MRSAVIIGLGAIGLMSAGLLWQAAPSKRVLMTDEHPAVIDLAPPVAPAVAQPTREPMTATRENADPQGPITPDFERGVCYLYRVAFGQGYVTIDGKQYDCR